MPDAQDTSVKPGNSVYDEKLIPRICELASLGVPQNLIARAIRIAPETFSRWLGKHKDLNEAFQQAKLDCALQRLAAIRDAQDKNGFPNWQANAWLLARMYPGEFSQPDTKVEVRNETSVTVNVITPERLKQLQERRMQGLRNAGLVHGAN